MGDRSSDALSGNLLHLADLTSVCCFFWESCSQGSTDRVGRVVLHVSSQMQQVFFSFLFSFLRSRVPLALVSLMYGFYRKFSMRQCARFVEDDRIHFRQSIYIVGPFD